MTPCSCGWAAAPGKCNDRRSCSGVKLQIAPVSPMHSCSRVLSDPTDRQIAVIPGSSHAVAAIAQQWTASRWQVGPCVQFSGGISLRRYSVSANLDRLQSTDTVLIRRQIQRACSLFDHRSSGQLFIAVLNSRQREIQFSIQRNFFESRKSR